MELSKQIKDDDSFLYINAVIDYITDIFDRTEKVQTMMDKYVSDNYIVIASMEITEVSNLDKVEIDLHLKDDNYEPKESERVAFMQFANKYFETKKSFYSKLRSLGI